MVVTFYSIWQNNNVIIYGLLNQWFSKWDVLGVLDVKSLRTAVLNDIIIITISIIKYNYEQI